MSDAPEAGAAGRWAAQLAEWAIPDHIMAQAPESPWRFLPSVFAAPADPGPDTPSRRRAREALPAGGTVLDVGCGGGAAGLALAPGAGRLVGFDQSEELLELFATRAAELGVDHSVIHGSWPEQAAAAPIADVVVSHHVAYNVPALAAFAAALTDHARRRVVVELTDRHPRVGLNHLWRHFWALDRPSGPTADDAVAVLRQAGIEPEVERSPRRYGEHDRARRVAAVRRYLCLPPERDAEVDEVLGGPDDGAPLGDNVTLWWPGRAAS